MTSRHLFTLWLLALMSFSAVAGDWSFKDVAGNTHTLSGERGKWVLVNFWAPWCPPCIQEIPDLVALKNRPDVQVIGVAVMYKAHHEVMDVARQLAINYPIVLGDEDTAGDFGGISALPTSFLYSPAGQLVGRHEGPLTRDEVGAALEGKAPALFTR
jgi:thiol-disulfide isomerase/thioredoxin